MTLCWPGLAWPGLAWQHVTVADVPDSKKNPFVTKAPVLVRWVSLPVYADSNTARLRPDAVLLKGDVMNMRTSTMER
jgi:hypothetical protein